MPKSQKTLFPQESSEKRISTEWFHGTAGAEDRASIEQAWRNSTYVLGRLKEILARRIYDLETDKEDDYNNPQWPVLRADRNGELRSLKRTILLLP